MAVVAGVLLKIIGAVILVFDEDVIVIRNWSPVLKTKSSKMRRCLNEPLS